jgi:PDDEXK-like domain of unknown function (DUF3799)
MALDVGIYPNVPAATYHADPCIEPSLTSSIAKMLCLSSPLHAWYQHPRLNPAPIEDDCEAFDIGTAAHALLLEQRSAITVIDAADWRTKDAKAQRDHARTTGMIPLLKKKWADVQAMATAARVQLAAHRDGAAEMFTAGHPEQTLIWKEGDTWCRARLDWMRPDAIDDYKTTSATANPETWSRTLFGAGADIQAAWYIRGLKALTGIDGTFRFAVQETYPPYALAVIGLGPDALVLAEKKCLYALDLWKASLAANKWDGYPKRTCWASLPMAHEAWWLDKEMR